MVLCTLSARGAGNFFLDGVFDDSQAPAAIVGGVYDNASTSFVQELLFGDPMISSGCDRLSEENDSFDEQDDDDSSNEGDCESFPEIFESDDEKALWDSVPIVSYAAEVMSQSLQRARALLSVLQKDENTTYANVCHAIYKDLDEDVFRRDILLLAQGGALFLTHSGQIRFYGSVDVSKSLPTKGVARAMFDLINSGVVDPFCLQLNLYNEGHRIYSLEFLTLLEEALFYGGVHLSAYRNNAYTHCVYEDTQEFWKQNRALSREDFNKAMAGKTRYQKSVLEMLFWTQENKELTLLEGLMPQRRAFYTICDRHKKIIKLWSQYKDKPYTFKDLLDVVHLPLQPKKGMSAFRQEVLRLALEGWPIDYDKEAGTVALLSSPKTLIPLKDNENMATVIYDCVLRWGKDSAIDELAYYAYQRGCWHRGFCWHNAVRARFEERVCLYKLFLVVLGVFDVTVFTPSTQKKATRQKVLWNIVMSEGFVRPVTDYKDWDLYNVTGEDVNTILWLKKFLQEEDCRVLKEYVLAHPVPKQCQLKLWGQTERFVIKLLTLSEHSPQKLRLIFRRRFGLKGAKKYWQFLDNLALAPGIGRVRYSVERGRFYWDRLAPPPRLQTEEGVIEVLELKTNHPKMNSCLMTFVMRQKGFRSIVTQNVRVIISGLEVLGMLPSELALFSLKKKWDFVDRLLQKGDQSQKNSTTQDKCSSLDCSGKICCKVVSWVRLEGFMKRLWQAYLDLLQDDDEGPSPKRQKRNETPNAQDVIRTRMPKLYAVLREKNVF